MNLIWKNELILDKLFDEHHSKNQAKTPILDRPYRNLYENINPKKAFELLTGLLDYLLNFSFT